MRLLLSKSTHSSLQPPQSSPHKKLPHRVSSPSQPRLLRVCFLPLSAPLTTSDLTLPT